jgi:hypothetical protein
MLKPFTSSVGFLGRGRPDLDILRSAGAVQGLLGGRLTARYTACAPARRLRLASLLRSPNITSSHPPPSINDTAGRRQGTAATPKQRVPNSELLAIAAL